MDPSTTRWVIASGISVPVGISAAIDPVWHSASGAKWEEAVSVGPMMGAFWLAVKEL